MQIPLFPLHTVLAPGIALPLHIFEDRYRLMVRRCLDDATPFGVVLIRDGSEVAPVEGGTVDLAIASVGTLAEIQEASLYPDGRWDILCVGRSRFVIHDVLVGEAPYLVAEADLLPDVPGDPGATEALVETVTRRFVDYLRLLQPRDGETAEPIDVQMEVEVVDETAGDADDVGDADDADEDDADAAAGMDRTRASSAGSAWSRDTSAPFPDSDPVPLPVHDAEATRAALRIPDDPSVLSFLLTGIVQAEPGYRQQLLEAPSAEDRLRAISALLDREIDLLARRLAPFAVDRRVLAGTSN
jgi:Lon protease-like protein